MGRRSFISVTAIKRLISANNARRRAEEREQLINSQIDVKKEIPPTYSLLSIDFNPTSRSTKIEILRTQKYRTIARYVTRNYVRYPIYSEWKTKTRIFKKTIKLTNEALESLNYHSEVFISNCAKEIILALDNEELFPSWFIREMLFEEYTEKVDTLNEAFDVFKSDSELSINAYKGKIGNTEEMLLPLKQQLDKKLSKQRKLDERISKVNAAKKSTAKYILTFFIYAYLISTKRKSKLIKKLDDCNGKIEILEKDIEQKEHYISECKSNIKNLENEIVRKQDELKENLCKASTELETKRSQITPLTNVPSASKTLLEPNRASVSVVKDFNADNDHNDFYGDKQTIESCPEITKKNTEEIPDYLIEQQQALDYIEKNEGKETDEGEHYYKLAMCYFKLQKACYRPMLIANLEKYLVSNPYTAIYKNYKVGEYNSQFSPQPARENEYELSERNFLREIYFFLGRAYEQEGNGEKAIYYLDLAMGIIPEGAEHFIIELFSACKKANNLPLFLTYCEQLPQTEMVNAYHKQAKELIKNGYVYKPRKNKNLT